MSFETMPGANPDTDLVPKKSFWIHNAAYRHKKMVGGQYLIYSFGNKSMPVKTGKISQI
jgi:hypothetical protein